MWKDIFLSGMVASMTTTALSPSPSRDQRTSPALCRARLALSPRLLIKNGPLSDGQIGRATACACVFAYSLFSCAICLRLRLSSSGAAPSSWDGGVTVIVRTGPGRHISWVARWCHHQRTVFYQLTGAELVSLCSLCVVSPRRKAFLLA